MEEIDEEEGKIISFFNAVYDRFSEKQISSISEIRNPDTLYSLLTEM